MDYILARWFAVAFLDDKKLQDLHKLELALNACQNKETNSQKFFWWQQSAGFLKQEFKNFWRRSKNKEGEILNFEDKIKNIFAQNKNITENTLLKNINFMHQCDKVLHASSKTHHSSKNTFLLNPKGSTP